MLNILIIFLISTVNEIIQAAPWLLFGFIVAGLIHILIPSELVKKLLSGRGFYPILKGSLIGIPLPLCSCSVIPVARSLRQSGASIGATASFLTSTPQIGVDSFVVTKGLLGLPMAFLRVLVAFYSSLLAGILVSRYGEDIPVAAELKSCCKSNKDSSEMLETKSSMVKTFLEYTFITLPSDLFKPLVTGFLVAGLVSAFLPVQSADASSGVFTQVIFMLIVSIPMYTCAVSSTPIAQALFLKGIHPAAILVFLIGGPASNATTIFATREEFGTKGMYAYLISLVFSTLTAAYAVYYFYDVFFKEFTLASLSWHHDHDHYNILYMISAIALCIIFIFAKVVIWKRKNTQRDAIKQIAD